MAKSKYFCQACDEFKVAAVMANLGARVYCKTCLEGALKRVGEGFPDRDDDETEEGSDGR